jgi:hypothetical protein
MSIKSDPEFVGDFDKDVPEHLHEDVLQRLVEAAWEVGSQDPDISIDDVAKSNALNIEFTGTILVDGIEHSFHIRDGNNAGTEILSWNGDAAIHREDPIVTTLVPQQGIIGDAIHRGHAARLLQDWDAALDPSTGTGASLSQLPGAAAYDAYFAPGTGASRSHHEKARAAGYEIEEMAVATRIRAELLGAAFLPCPVVGRRSCGTGAPPWFRGPTSALPATMSSPPWRHAGPRSRCRTIRRLCWRQVTGCSRAPGLSPCGPT